MQHSSRARLSVRGLASAGFALLVLGAGGCLREKENHWDPAATPAATTATGAAVANPPPGVGDKRIVLFAPLATGPLTDVYPDARLDYANSCANRVHFLSHDADGKVGDTLPAADAVEWTKGPLPGAAGAWMVVLVTVLDVKTGIGPITPMEPDGEARAVVEVKGLDANGAVVFCKKGLGRASGTQSVKLMSPASKPASLATWDATSNALGALIHYIDNAQDLPAVSGYEITIDSDPHPADILIDGTYRNATPWTVNLPPTSITVRIERPGYQPWQRQIVPAKGMRIQPVLAKIGDPTPTAENPLTAPLPGTAPAVVAPTADQPATATATGPQPVRAAPEDPLAPPPTPDHLTVPGDK
jgi:hypothetical protein